jgi:hypothetical protein
MGKKKKQGNGYGKGTFIETSLFLSKAYLNLGIKGTSPVTSHASHKILIMFLGKRSFGILKDRKGIKHGRNIRTDDNRFTLTYAELKGHGISQKSSTRGFDELLAKGFISIVDPGGAFEKHKAVYALEDTYLLWNPEQKQVFDERQRDVPRGYQVPRKNNHCGLQGGTPTQTPEGDTPHIGHGLQRGTPHNQKNRGKMNEGT